jgi:hypothetical protein
VFELLWNKNPINPDFGAKMAHGEMRKTLTIEGGSPQLN